MQGRLFSTEAIVTPVRLVVCLSARFIEKRDFRSCSLRKSSDFLVQNSLIYYFIHYFVRRL